MSLRAVRIANCSGYKSDPGWQMLRQATMGEVDFITGDYLAEMNMAEDAEAYRAGKHDGWERTAWEGLKESLNVVAERKIKVIINGGALNPAGLAHQVSDLATKRGLKLRIAYVSGDDLTQKLGPDLASLQERFPPHLDSANPNIKVPQSALEFRKRSSVPLTAANAYLGARAIVRGLRAGADIIICGRVSDASPVIGAAWYWHSWSDTDYDKLAGALVAGHLIECSAYSTGGNFSGFTDYDLENFIDPGFPFAEIESDGSCVISKHEGTGGIVNEDTIRCQFLYELQGNIYLHSDVKAYLNNVTIQSDGPNRVRVSEITGHPPPPTTKVAIFYKGGYQSELLLNATGYGTDKKWTLIETQVRKSLAESGLDKAFSVLEFQIVGIPEPNPRSQLRSTTYCRLFAESTEVPSLVGLLHAFRDIALKHFSGLHASLDMRTAFPRQFLSYYPALYPQDSLDEAVTLLTATPNTTHEPLPAGHPPKYEQLEERDNYNTLNPEDIASMGPTTTVRLGDIALGRSGDKGSNLNCGIFVRDNALWNWFRSFLSRERMITLIGEDWCDDYFLERVEFPNINAVHFVIYGILGRGVSGSTRLDSLGKGFVDYIRDKHIEIPLSLVDSHYFTKLSDDDRVAMEGVKSRI